MRLPEDGKTLPPEQLGSHWSVSQGPDIGRGESSTKLDPVRVAVWGGILLAAPLTWAGIIKGISALLAP